MASEQVLKFLTDHNRPFSVSDIMKGMGEGWGKAKVQKALDDLTSQDKVLEKTYNKQKIYCVVQASDVPARQITETILEIDRKINDYTLRLKGVEGSLQNSGAKLKELQPLMTVEEAEKKRTDLKDEVQKMEEELDALVKSKTKSYTKEEKGTITKEYGTVVKEYNRRKRMCMDMVDAIFENYPKGKKVLLQEMCLETDDDVNFKIKIQPK